MFKFLAVTALIHQLLECHIVLFNVGVQVEEVEAEPEFPRFLMEGAEAQEGFRNLM
jgi:hypothetical protein